MYPAKDFWFYLLMAISVTAMFAWAFSSVTGLGSEWVPWVALSVTVLALGIVGTRAGLQAKRVVWTEEMRLEQVRHIRRMPLEMAPLMVFSLGQLALNKLSTSGVLPVWASCVLWVALVVGAISLWRVISRNSVKP